MGEFRRDRNSRGGRGRDDRGGRDYNRRSFGGRDAGRPMMYSATCDQCGKPCEVPFRPSGEKPVYCSDCFESRGDGNSRPRRYDDRNDRRSSYNDRPMYSAICDKCGRECEVPFRPSGESPVYCRDCFRDSDGGRGGGGKTSAACDCEDSKKLLIEINQKLDKILRDLGTTKFIRVPLEKGADQVEIAEVKTDAKTKPEAKAKTKAEAKKKKVSKPKVDVVPVVEAKIEIPVREG